MMARGCRLRLPATSSPEERAGVHVSPVDGPRPRNHGRKIASVGEMAIGLSIVDCVYR